MEPYRHTQIGWLIIGIMLPVIAVLVLIMALDEAVIVGAVAGVILVLCLVLFSSLTVTVSPELIRLRFGPGPIGKRFPIAEIRSAKAVRNRWYYGWGIRMLFSSGWLFNVSGFDAVELTMTDGQKYRIGTDEPQALLAAIRQWCPTETGQGQMEPHLGKTRG